MALPTAWLYLLHGQVCSSISEVYDTHECYVLVKLDLQRIKELHLYVTARTVREAILAAPKLKIKETDVHLDHDHAIKVYAGRSDREDTAVFELQRLQMALKEVIVAGIHAIPRAIITRKEEGEKTPAEKGRVCFQLLVEGMGLQAVMGVKGLRGETARTTHVMEVEKVLGIEAARKTTMDEIQFTMRSHGMDIDDRHVTLLADVMTFRGEVLGITRFGVPKMKQSVLMLASFEKTSDHLYDAAVHSRTDAVAGVSECIITGVPMPVGTVRIVSMRSSTAHHHGRADPEAVLTIRYACGCTHHTHACCAYYTYCDYYARTILTRLARASSSCCSACPGCRCRRARRS